MGDMDDYKISLKDKAVYEDKDTKEVTLPLLPQEFALIQTLNKLSDNIDSLTRAIKNK